MAKGNGRSSANAATLPTCPAARKDTGTRYLQSTYGAKLYK